MKIGLKNEINWLYVGVTFALIATFYLSSKIFSYEDGLDFRLLWLSGQVWANGGNPYDGEFITAYKLIFGDGPVSHFWVYPPSWSIITIPLSLLSFKQALLAWNVLNFLMLVALSYLTASAACIQNKRKQVLYALFTY